MIDPSEINDPIERIVAEALVNAGIYFEIGERLDFFLPSFYIHIECKQFFTPRISAQLQLASDVIVIQGKTAAEAFATMLNGGTRA